MSVEVPVPHPSADVAASTPSTTATRPPVDRAVPPVADYAPVFTTTLAPTRWGGPSTGGHAARRALAAHWLTTAITSLVLTGFAALIVSGRVVTEGPVLLVLSRTHGVHLGDLYVLVAWCAGVGAPVVHGLRLQRAAGR